ncbi:Monoterpene epsilon-lactone hydrolase, partial [Globisporangium splendens]
MVPLVSLLVFVAEALVVLPVLLVATVVATFVQFLVRGCRPRFPKWTFRFEIATALKRCITERYGESMTHEPAATRFRRATEFLGNIAGCAASRAHGTLVEPEIANGLEHLWIRAAGTSTAGGRQRNTQRFVVLYYHGGGYVVYCPRYFIAHCNLLRATILDQLQAQFPDDNVELDVFIANYRKAPLHPFPVPAEDAVLAYEFLVQRHKIAPNRILLAGDSAGGGLVMSTLLRLRDAGKSSIIPLAAMITCPYVDMSPEESDFVPPPHCGLSQSLMAAFRRALLKDPGNPALWRPYSAVHSDLRNLPPVFVQAADLDYIFNNATRLIAKAEADGVKNWEIDIHEGVPHVFTTSSPSVLPYALIGVQRISRKKECLSLRPHQHECSLHYHHQEARDHSLAQVRDGGGCSDGRDGDIARITTLVQQQQEDARVFRQITEAIELAVEEGDVEIVEPLLNAISNQELEESQQERLKSVAYWQQLLGVALKSGDAATLDCVLTRASQYVTLDLNARIPTYKEPLVYAVRRQLLDHVRMLMAHGADITAWDERGHSLLHVAAPHRDCVGLEPHGAALLAFLIQKMPEEIDTMNAQGDTAAHVAAFHGSANAVKALIQVGADVNLRNHVLESPLHIALGAGSKELIDTLVLSGHADVNARGDVGNTLLVIGVKNFEREDSRDRVCALELLLQHGADVNALNERSSTALASAIFHMDGGDDSIPSLLLRYGANTNEELRNGDTPLHVAARRAVSFEMWKNFRKHGADPFTQNDDGKTPLDLLGARGDQLKTHIMAFISEMEEPSSSPPTAKKSRLT